MYLYNPISPWHPDYNQTMFIIIIPNNAHRLQARLSTYLQKERYLGHLLNKQYQSKYTNLLLGVLTLSRVHKQRFS